MFLNIPEKGRTTTPCPTCSVKPGNLHSISQSGECDGIRSGSINSTDALKIRLRNSGKRERKAQED